MASAAPTQTGIPAVPKIASAHTRGSVDVPEGRGIASRSVKSGAGMLSKTSDVKVGVIMTLRTGAYVS